MDLVIDGIEQTLILLHRLMNKKKGERLVVVIFEDEVIILANC